MSMVTKTDIKAAEDADTSLKGKKLNKWKVTKHHIDKKDWFTLKSKFSNYFLTCTNKTVTNKNLLYVYYEIPSTYSEAFRGHSKTMWINFYPPPS